MTDEIAEVLDSPGVVRRRLDMCRFNLRAKANGEEGFVLKPTSIMTNSQVLGNHLARRCLGNHKHIQLKGGNKCTDAALYTREFCEAVVDGFKLHLAKAGKPCRRVGSLQARDFEDSRANTLDLAEDDPEDKFLTLKSL